MAKVEDAKATAVDLNKIDYEFPYSVVKDMKIFGEDEKEVTLDSIIGGKKLVLLFTRHFG